MIVNVSCLFLEVELNPVVESNKFILSPLSNKNMLKTAGVKVPT